VNRVTVTCARRLASSRYAFEVSVVVSETRGGVRQGDWEDGDDEGYEQAYYGDANQQGYPQEYM